MSAKIISHEWMEVFRDAKFLGIPIRIGKSILVDIKKEDEQITGVYVEKLNKDNQQPFDYD